jgi:hypothetical protein
MLMRGALEPELNKAASRRRIQLLVTPLFESPNTQ